MGCQAQELISFPDLAIDCLLERQNQEEEE